MQDHKGQPLRDECGHREALVKPSCGPFSGDYIRMENWWRATIRPGDRCPCGVAFSNPPYSVIPPLRSALEDFSNDGFESQVAIYTGDLAGHFMPGTSVELDQMGCTTAKAVIKSTIDELNVPGIQHFFVMGNYDVLPKNRPLTADWLEDLGNFLLNREWITEDELTTWVKGGFYWRMLHTTGLCAIGLNSNHWTPNQVNVQMQRAQLEWLPGALSRKGETAACTSGFLIVSHIGVVCPGAPVHDGAVKNDALWDASKNDPKQCSQVRAILDKYEDAIVAELSGDLNKEHIYASGKKSFGFTAVGVSRRGGNDPGFNRFFMSADGTMITEVESYQMKRGCVYEFGHSMVDDYAPHFNEGFSGHAVAALLKNESKVDVRKANVAPNAAGITKKAANSAAYIDRVRKGEAGCLAPSEREVLRAEYVSRLEQEGINLLGVSGIEDDDGEITSERHGQQIRPARETSRFSGPAWSCVAAFAALLAAVAAVRRSARTRFAEDASFDLRADRVQEGPDYVEVTHFSI